jgi:acyl-CoA reductase-like NAD-dependent aldehyde dehydrogenase
VGNGLDPETTMGPLVSQEQFDRVTGYIKSGRDKGVNIMAATGSATAATSSRPPCSPAPART